MLWVVAGSSNDQFLPLTPAQEKVISSTSQGFLGNLDTQQKPAVAPQRGCRGAPGPGGAASLRHAGASDISDSPLKLHMEDSNAVVICDYKAKKHHSSSGVQKYYLPPCQSSRLLCVLALANATVLSGRGCYGDKLHFFRKLPLLGKTDLYLLSHVMLF